MVAGVHGRPFAALAAIVIAGGCTGATDLASPLAAGAADAPSLDLAAPPPLTTSFFGSHAVQLRAAVGGGRRPARSAAPTVRWLVRDTAVAVVDSGGYLEARRVGTTFVVASIGAEGEQLIDSAAVTVAPTIGGAVTVIAHRGFALHAPENTLPAVERAFELGADAVEVDVALTSDGVPVIMHDPTVDRTTNGRGAVAALTAAQVRGLDACSKLDARSAPCPVPTLAEVLAATAARPGARLFLDLKGAYTPAQLAALAAQVRAAGMRGRVMFIDFDYSHLVALRRADPGARLGYLSHGVVSADLFTALGGASALYSKRALGGPSAPAHLHALRERGVESGVWTIDSAAEARALVAAGVRSVITDLPLDRATLAAP